MYDWKVIYSNGRTHFGEAKGVLGAMNDAQLDIHEAAQLEPHLLVLDVVITKRLA